MEKFLQLAIESARQAGEVLLRYYGTPVQIQTKGDGTPVSVADLEASQLIVDRLKASGLPVLSEEDEIEYSVRQNWERYWLVDPLDGTQGFLNGSPEFTVNIALIDRGRPVLGVVHAPTFQLMAWATEGQGAFLQSPDGIQRLQAKSPEEPVAVRSRACPDRIEDFFRENGIARGETVGSALKFIRVAQGAAGIYARFSGSKEWDTAAGHILLLEAGGWIFEPQSRKPPAYNKADLENSPFVVGCGDLDPTQIRWPNDS